MSKNPVLKFLNCLSSRALFSYESLSYKTKLRKEMKRKKNGFAIVRKLGIIWSVSVAKNASMVMESSNPTTLCELGFTFSLINSPIPATIQC